MEETEMRKYITDYLKEHGEFAYNSETNGNFTLRCRGNNIQLDFNIGCDTAASMGIPIKQKPKVIEDTIFGILAYFQTEIRFCQHCGMPIDYGYTDDEGWLYCCEDCFGDEMDECYGKGKWRTTETAGVNGGYYEYYDEHFKEWCDTGIYYTEWY